MGHDDGEEDDDHEGGAEEEDGGQDCACYFWQEERGCHEEEGCGHLRSQEAQPCAGGYLRWDNYAADGGDEEDLGLHQEVQAQRGPDYQARLEVEGCLASGEHRHVENGWLHQQALVLRPWASPGQTADEFQRRAGLSSRDIRSCARVLLEGLRIDPSS